jgi:hypothetical protein
LQYTSSDRVAKCAADERPLFICQGGLYFGCADGNGEQRATECLDEKAQIEGTLSGHLKRLAKNLSSVKP